jgi:hypothetical protein
MKIEIILALVLVSVFVIDYLIKKKKENSVDDLVDNTVLKDSIVKSSNFKKTLLIIILFLIPIQTYINTGLSNHDKYYFAYDESVSERKIKTSLPFLLSPSNVFSIINDDPLVLWDSFIGVNAYDLKYKFNFDNSTRVIPSYLNFIYIFIGLIYSIFFYLPKRKKIIINKNQYFIKRRKNITLFIFSIPLTKVILHYTLYPNYSSRITRSILNTTSVKESLGSHFDEIFTDELWLFIPAFILVGLIVWFFNDKIKAR